MSAPDEFRQLGYDLMRFIKQPEAKYNLGGKFTSVPSRDPLREKSQYSTPWWRIVRTGYVHSSTSVDYAWRGHRNNVPPGEHTLFVALSDTGQIGRFVLGYTIAPRLINEISYEVADSRIRGVMFARRELIGPRSDRWLIARQSDRSVEEVLDFIPAGMTPSFPRVELVAL